jgi:hypothetical protein
LRPIFEALLSGDGSERAPDIEAVLAKLDERPRRILTEILFADLGIDERDAAAQALHCLEALEVFAREREREQLKRRIREAEQGGNLEQALRLMDELNGLADGPSRA